MRIEVDYKLVGRRIRDARKAMGLTQEQLAEQVDLSNEWVSQLEKGKKLPLDTLMRFSSVLDKDPNYFLIDTPFVPSEVLINKDIARKLARCNKNTLNSINQIIDVLLEQQETESKYNP